MLDKIPKPIILIILDGWGLTSNLKGNAVALAKTPNIDKYWHIYPHTELEASQEAVGLPKGEPGNSEAGHLNLGAGRIVYQSLPQINMAIADGTFFQTEALKAVKEHLEKNKSNLHLLGLLGSGGVHSSIEHLFALLRWAKEQKIKNVFLHLFTDGRDSPPTSSRKFLALVEEKIKFYGLGAIASLIGRFYAMDRDNRWNRIQKAYEALTEGKGILTENYNQVIQKFYQVGKTDEFIEPIIISKNGKPIGLINDNDAVIFFNFRIDRPRELTKAFVLPDFENLTTKKKVFDPYAERYGKKQYAEEPVATPFQRHKICHNLLFTTMTEYEPGLPVLTIFPPNQINLPLARILSQENWRQLHIAETEKERHVTYYFDGKRETPFKEEDWVIIPSPKVKTYDLQPEMSANQITEEVIKRVKLNIYDFILINFANPDMVGHTGILNAGIKACETTDACLGKVVETTLALGGICLVTADHGNVEEMINLQTGKPDTQHSTNPVPFIITAKENNFPLTLPKGVLADIAPTILKLAKISKPVSMTGESLI